MHRYASIAFTFDVDQHTVGFIACSSPCATCSSASFCLSCKSPQLASSGQCVSTCPTGTFRSSGACLKCHPDCASCSGSSFEQCSTCFPTRPVLSSGRCLPTCAESQFFDLTNSKCQDCDSSCSSCFGPGSTNCLACSSPTQVLRAGSCVSANCVGSSNVVPDLGICLSDLLQGSPILNSTTTTTASSSSASNGDSNGNSDGSTTPSYDVNGGIVWWEILLIVLGGIIFIVVIFVLWRRCTKDRRLKETVNFTGVKERLRMMQLRERWLRDRGEYHPEGLSMAYPDHLKYRGPSQYHPKGLSMAYHDDLKYRSPSHIDLDRHRDSRSVYSQDMDKPWQGPETYPIISRRT